MTQETHHHSEPGTPQERKSILSFRSSFWFVVIIVGFFIAALNYVNIMSNDNGEGNKISDVPKPVESPMQATSSQTLAGEKGQGEPIGNTAKSSAIADTIHGNQH
ncbi:MAG TPA: hypothetical protein VN721_11745 [Flavipsychrobacter sp.]|nr:hypothetical protein [Flavipsychrobacter sp.]